MANVYAIGFPSGRLYIGITKGTVARRFNRHISDTRAGAKLPIHHALRKYGRNVRLIILAQGMSFDEAKDLEIWWISQLSTMKPGGYNLTAGGEGSIGCHPTTETRCKMSKARLGNRNALGHVHDEETRHRIKEAANRPEHRQAIAEGLRTPEAKKRQSKAQLRRYRNA